MARLDSRSPDRSREPHSSAGEWAAKGHVAEGGNQSPIAGAAGDYPQQAARYGAGGSGPRVRSMALVIVLHGVAIAALMMAGYADVISPPKRDLTTFDVSRSEPPPPAPPQPELVEPQQVEIVRPSIVAPTPPVAVPTKNTVQAIAEPPKLKVAAVAVRDPAPAESPAPTTAPAPITPPDFSAAQLNNPGPSYPYLSRKTREEGVVMLKVRVGSNGRAQSVQVHNSSGHDRLDKAAVDTVRKWRFVPARQAGEPVEAWVLVPVTFKLG